MNYVFVQLTAFIGNSITKHVYSNKYILFVVLEIIALAFSGTRFYCYVKHYAF